MARFSLKSKLVLASAMLTILGALTYHLASSAEAKQPKMPTSVTSTDYNSRFERTCAAKKNRIKAAIARYDKALAGDLDPAQKVALSYCRAQALATLKGNEEESLAAYDQALAIADKSSPELSGIWRGKATVLGWLERHDEALLAIEQAVQANPEDETAWLMKSLMLSDLSQSEDALLAIDKAIELDLGDAGFRVVKGRVLIKLEQSEEALKTADQAITLDPKYGRAWSDRGRALQLLDRHEEAIAAFDQALKLMPSNASGSDIIWGVGKGYSLDQLHRTEEAIAAYEMAIKIYADPSYERSLFRSQKKALAAKSRRLEKQGKPEAAIALYDKALTKDLSPSQKIDLLTELGQFLDGLGRSDRTLKRYAQSLAIAKGDPLQESAVLINRAFLLDAVSRDAEALSALDTALNIIPTDEWPEKEGLIWQQKGHIFQKLEKRDDAIAAYKKSIGLYEAAMVRSPNNVSYLKRKNYLSTVVTKLALNSMEDLAAESIQELESERAIFDNNALEIEFGDSYIENLTRELEL